MDTVRNGGTGRYLTLREAMVLGPLVFSLANFIAPLLRAVTIMDQQYDLMSMRMGMQNDQEEFDFIIVGGGSAGCVLANKLSEDYSVLLLEYGGSPSVIQYFPFYTFALYNDPNIDWGHYTVPQRNASFALINNSVLWSNGKLLGGSSQLNAMMYVRGNVQGFDGIAETTGDPRWKMENILRYYKRIEDYKGWFDTDEHGKGGPLHIEKPQLAGFTEYFLRAGEELGYPIRDPNAYGPYTEGVAPMDLYMKGGRRSDSYEEFIVPIMQDRSSLVIRKYAHVRKILFTYGTTHVYGVEYLRHGEIKEARARKEVILSAGTVNTAKLLMLSGIGPKEHLNEVGIEPVVDLPVGQYLQDKYGTYVGPFMVQEGKSIKYDRDLTIGSYIEWLMYGTGIFKSSLSEGTYAIYTDAAKKDGRLGTPDIHTYVVSTSFFKELQHMATKNFNLRPRVAHHLAAASDNDHFYQAVTINRQQGHGFVKLRDANPDSPPLIDPKYLENEKDLASLVEGIKFSIKLVENTTAFKEIGGHLYTVPFPGCEHYEFKSHDYFECLARQTTLTAFKYAGSAPMGRNRTASPDAVVDSHLRVFGTHGLRVIDGSVLQQKYVSINDVTCRMMGLIGSDIIKEDWNLNNELK